MGTGKELHVVLAAALLTLAVRGGMALADGKGRPFDRAAAMAALAAAAGEAQLCKVDPGPRGTARVSVTFAPSGSVTAAQVKGPPFAGTPVGGCIAAAFRGAHVPPFDGKPVTVTKAVTIQ